MTNCARGFVFEVFIGLDFPARRLKSKLGKTKQRNLEKASTIIRSSSEFQFGPWLFLVVVTV